jgi:hypothetical protein
VSAVVSNLTLRRLLRLSVELGVEILEKVDPVVVALSLSGVNLELLDLTPQRVVRDAEFPG